MIMFALVMDHIFTIHFMVLAILTLKERTTANLLDHTMPNEDPIVSTNCGKVRGEWVHTENGYVFRGIPYASPPTGNLRWRPPVGTRKENKNCWKGILSAKKFGSPCVQRDPNNVTKVVGNEDCLYLNVFTPSLDVDARLPVLFWVHGGFLTIGSGTWHEIGYAPTVKLAAKLNVVFVSINYRLNAFGFMALEWLKADSWTNTSGNYGFMDMLEGLRWVQDNIRKFGGDPDMVTAFGHSSGGTALLALLASPLSKSLFHKVWMSSASPILNKTAPEAFKDNEIFINNTGCMNVSCLYNLEASEVISSVPWDVYPYWEMTEMIGLPENGKFYGAVAIVDGYVLQEAPFEAWVHGNAIDVPVLIGTTAQEADLIPLPAEVVNWTWATSYYRDHVTSKLSKFSNFVSAAAMHLYPENVSTPEFQLTSMSTDIRVTCGTDYFGVILASGIMSPVHRYVATYYTKDQPAYPFGSDFAVKYAYHGIDIIGFFETMDQALRQSPGLNDRLWEDRIQREVMAFVKTGIPETPEWKRYPDITAELDTTVTAYRGYHTAQCLFWLQNGFFSYSWIN